MHLSLLTSWIRKLGHILINHCELATWCTLLTFSHAMGRTSGEVSQIHSSFPSSHDKQTPPSDSMAESAMKAFQHCKLHGDGNHSTTECCTLKCKEKEKAKAKKKKKKGKEKEKANKANKSSSDSDLDSSNKQAVFATGVHILQKLHVMGYIVSDPQDKQTLIVDSGASTHMIPHIQWLVPGTFKPTKVIWKVHLGDDSILEGHSTGTLCLTTKGQSRSKMVDLPNVLLIPDLSATLISVHNLSKTGMKVMFKNGACKIKHGKDKHPFLTAQHLQGLYHINATPVTFTDHALAAAININVLHCWMGHMGINWLKQMVNKKQLEGVTELTGHPEFCEPCVLSKMKKLPLPRAERQKTVAPFEIVHSDVGGPVSPASPTGYCYWITFTDNRTWYPWIFYMKHKNKVFGIYKQFQADIKAFFFLNPN
jgi:hypothetical protein